MQVVGSYFSLSNCIEGLKVLVQSLFGATFHSIPLAPNESWDPHVLKLSLHHPEEVFCAKKFLSHTLYCWSFNFYINLYCWIWILYWFLGQISVIFVYKFRCHILYLYLKKECQLSDHCHYLLFFLLILNGRACPMFKCTIRQLTIVNCVIRIVTTDIESYTLTSISQLKI